MKNNEETTLRGQWILDPTGDWPAAEDLTVQTIYTWKVNEHGIE